MQFDITEIADEQIDELLERVMQQAKIAEERGQARFAAMVTDATGRVISEAWNTVRRERHVSRHAEINAIEAAQDKLERRDLSGLYLFASAEPCPMCAGAIYWSGISTLVYGQSIDEMIHKHAAHQQLPLSCREILAKSNREIRIIGPLRTSAGKRQSAK